jgi:UDP-N-acetylglucosamine:LPS N-acetylglucosamine transferase
MKLVIASGGTAGHIYPALAVAEELRRRGHTPLFTGTPGGMEARLAPAEGIAYQAFASTGFDRARPWTLLTSSLRLALSTRAARRWLFRESPAAVAGFGGYVSVPVGRAATQLGIPLLIHEQNSAAGWANRYLAKHAQAVALTYEDARLALALNPSATVTITGNPVRRTLLEASRADARTQAREMFRLKLGIPASALVLLVFGGSQGARHINSAVVALHSKLMALANLHIIHITGPKELARVEAAFAAVQPEKDVAFVAGEGAASVVAAPHRNKGVIPESAPSSSDRLEPTSSQSSKLKPVPFLRNRKATPLSAASLSHLSGAAAADSEHSSDAAAAGAGRPFGSVSSGASSVRRWHLIGYCDEMASAYAASDIAVARAGAGSLAEIETMGLPALLVPYPYATNDHQSANARSLVEAGAAIMVQDCELDTEKFATALLGILTDIPRQLNMQQAARALAGANSAAAVADMLLGIARD